MLLSCDIKYNANGLLTSVRRYEVDADDVATAVANSIYEYNANNAVTSITHNNSSGTQIVKHSYTYDSTNNIVEYLNSLDGSTSYDYDFLGQLISADYANATITDESYTYDSNGNRVVANGSNYTTSTNNELTSDGTWSYTYDDEGNRLTKTNSTNRELYTWDYRNRLTSVTQQEWDSTTETWTTTQTIEYAYDYNNVWIRKTLDSNGDGTADFKSIFIPENYQTVTQIDNGAISHHYLWTPNQQDKLLADVTPSDVLWSLTDHLGTIRDIVGNSTTHLIYDAYGNIISCKNSAGEMVNNPLLFAYTGKAFDTSTQLQNNINRWYDSTTGRWLSIDPIGFEGNDTNLYRYVGNRSLLFHDPTGLEPPFYIDPGLQIAQKNRETQAIRIQQLKSVTQQLRKTADIYFSQLKPLCDELDSCEAKKKGCDKQACLDYIKKIASLMANADYKAGGFRGYWESIRLANLLGLTTYGGKCLLWGAMFEQNLPYPPKEACISVPIGTSYYFTKGTWNEHFVYCVKSQYTDMILMIDNGTWGHIFPPSHIDPNDVHMDSVSEKAWELLIK